MARGGAARLIRFQPAAGLPYPQALRVDDPGFSRLRQIALGIGGAMLGLLLLFTVPSLVSQLVMRLFYWGSGSAGTWAEYSAAAAAFALPAGMASVQLGLASMILVSLALVLFVNRMHPHWLHSVQPGFRWRYAVAALLVAVVVIGGIWALTRIGQPWVLSPEPQLGWYLVAILVTTPLQAAGEEYFFRGYLLQAISLTAVDARAAADGLEGGRARAAGWLARQYPQWAGVVGSAVIFALLHPTPNVQSFLYPLGFGLVTGWLAVKTGGLEAGIAAHVINNVITFGYAAFSGSMVQAYANRSVDWISLVTTLVSFVFFGVVATWLARRMKLATTTPAPRFGDGTPALVK